MNARSPVQANSATLRSFVQVLHGQAARALAGADRPGLLQLVRVHPAREGAVSSRFTIGDVDGMVEAAIEDAASGHNVYVEARTVERGARGRGRTEDTRGVFAFVVDSDADKSKAATIDVQPSLVVETSPGNRHLWLFLERALTAAQAGPIGEALRRAVGADDNTGVITQPYRVAGTPNFPNAKKQARGRLEVARTRILETSGILWSRDALLEAFQVQVEADRAPGPGEVPRGRTGKSSLGATMLLAEIATPAMDRSAQFHRAIIAAMRSGLAPDDLEHLARCYSKGCASKYLEGRDRLRQEIERSWLKAKANTARPSCDPTYPNHAKPVVEARLAVEEAIRQHFQAAGRHGC